MSSCSPAMATAASALFSGRRIGLAEIPCSPANPRCFWLRQPWPQATVQSSPMCFMPPAMESRRSCPCSPSAPFSLSLPSVLGRPFLDRRPRRPIPFRGSICLRAPPFSRNRTRRPKRISPITHSRFENVKFTVLIQNTFSVITEMPLDLFCS